jgi:hypothetical protein
MDPVSVVVGALAAGALTGVSETATSTVRDAYSELKSLVSAQLGRRRRSTSALERFEADPEAGEAALRAALRRVGADTDDAVLAAAQRVMWLLDVEMTFRRERWPLQVGRPPVRARAFQEREAVWPQIVAGLADRQLAGARS